MQLVYSGHTGQHPLLVTDENNLRSLRFGTDERQSCIDLQTPWELQLAYTRWMATALLLHPLPDKFLLFGLGGCALPHFLLHHHPAAHIDIVEREAQVIQLAHGCFNLPRSDTLRIFNQDAVDFVRSADTSDYHVAFLDIFGPGSMASALFLSELYRAILALLAPNGVLAVNLWCGDQLLYQQALEAARQGGRKQVLEMPIQRRNNVILLVFPEAIPWKAIKQARKNSLVHQQRYNLDFSRYLKRLCRTNRPFSLASLFS